MKYLRYLPYLEASAVADVGMHGLDGVDLQPEVLQVDERRDGGRNRG